MTHPRLPTPTNANRIEHRIDIAAPAERVWDVLSDLAGWDQWNSVYTHAQAELEPGGTIRLTVTLPGMKPIDQQAVVLEAVPSRFRFHADVAGGLVRATRTFDIVPKTPGGCTVVSYEAFGGPLGWLMVAFAGKRVRKAIEMLNHALRQEAERPVS